MLLLYARKGMFFFFFQRPETLGIAWYNMKKWPNQTKKKCKNPVEKKELELLCFFSAHKKKDKKKEESFMLHLRVKCVL